MASNHIPVAGATLWCKFSSWGRRVADLRTLALLALGVILLVLAAGLSWNSFQNLTRTAQSRIHTYEILNHLNVTLASLLDVETGARGFALVGTSDYLEPYEQGHRVIESGLATLRTLTSDNPVQQQNLDSLEKLAQQRLSHSAELINIRRTQGLEAACQFIGTGSDKQIMDAARTVIAGMVAEEHRLLELRDASARRGQKISTMALIGTQGLTFTLFLAASIFYYREQRQRTMQSALQLQYHYTRSLIEASLDPLVTISVGGKITDVIEGFGQRSEKACLELCELLQQASLPKELSKRAKTLAEEKIPTALHYSHASVAKRCPNPPHEY